MAYLTPSFLNLESGVGVSYVEAFPDAGLSGNQSAPTILLLHGFPSSSSHYSLLIPLLLAQGFHVLAPDFPGYGFTSVPANYTYTFSHIASTISSFLDAKGVSSVAATYIFDYGAPVGFRLFTDHGLRTKAIISQNGNAYVEGLGSFWEPFKKFWESNNTASDREPFIKAGLTLEAIKTQYETGESPDRIAQIDPRTTYERDFNLILRPGNRDIQLDLFFDYRKNVELYPAWQKWLRETQVPVLAVWGKNDIIFVPPGAEAFKRDVKNAVVKLIDGGHFLSVTHAVEIAKEINSFLNKA